MANNNLSPIDTESGFIYAEILLPNGSARLIRMALRQDVFDPAVYIQGHHRLSDQWIDLATGVIVEYKDTVSVKIRTRGLKFEIIAILENEKIEITSPGDKVTIPHSKDKRARLVVSMLRRNRDNLGLGPRWKAVNCFLTEPVAKHSTIDFAYLFELLVDYTTDYDSFFEMNLEREKMENMKPAAKEIDNDAVITFEYDSICLGKVVARLCLKDKINTGPVFQIHHNGKWVTVAKLLKLSKSGFDLEFDYAGIKSNVNFNLGIIAGSPSFGGVVNKFYDRVGEAYPYSPVFTGMVDKGLICKNGDNARLIPLLPNCQYEVELLAGVFISEMMQMQSKAVKQMEKSLEHVGLWIEYPAYDISSNADDINGAIQLRKPSEVIPGGAMFSIFNVPAETCAANVDFYKHEEADVLRMTFLNMDTVATLTHVNGLDSVGILIEKGGRGEANVFNYADITYDEANIRYGSDYCDILLCSGSDAKDGKGYGFTLGFVYAFYEHVMRKIKSSTLASETNQQEKEMNDPEKETAKDVDVIGSFGFKTQKGKSVSCRLVLYPANGNGTLYIQLATPEGYDNIGFITAKSRPDFSVEYAYKGKIKISSYMTDSYNLIGINDVTMAVHDPNFILMSGDYSYAADPLLRQSLYVFNKLLQEIDGEQVVTNVKTGEPDKQSSTDAISSVDLTLAKATVPEVNFAFKYLGKVQKFRLVKDTELVNERPVIRIDVLNGDKYSAMAYADIESATLVSFYDIDNRTNPILKLSREGNDPIKAFIVGETHDYAYATLAKFPLVEYSNQGGLDIIEERSGYGTSVFNYFDICIGFRFLAITLTDPEEAIAYGWKNLQDTEEEIQNLTTLESEPEMTNKVNIDLTQLSKSDLQVMQYRIDNQIRIKRIEAVKEAVKDRPLDALARYEYDRLLTELRYGRNIFIDDFLDRLEIRLGLDAE